MAKTEPSRSAAAPYAFRCMESTGNAAQITTPGGKACDCGAFQPLFKADGSKGQPGDPREEIDRIEQARCRGTQRGLDSGREEACRMARGALSPGLKAFVHTLNDLSLSNQRMKEQVSAKVIELALSICERVMGENPRVTSDALKDLKTLIGDTLAKCNRLALHLNPKDVQGIEALMAFEGMEWPQYPFIDIESDALVPSGELRIMDQADGRESLDGCVLSALSEILSRNNPPTA